MYSNLLISTEHWSYMNIHNQPSVLGEREYAANMSWKVSGALCFVSPAKTTFCGQIRNIQMLDFLIMQLNINDEKLLITSPHLVEEIQALDHHQKLKWPACNLATGGHTFT